MAWEQGRLVEARLARPLRPRRRRGDPRGPHRPARRRRAPDGVRRAGSRGRHRDPAVGGAARRAAPGRARAAARRRVGRAAGRAADTVVLADSSQARAGRGGGPAARRRCPAGCSATPARPGRPTCPPCAGRSRCRCPCARPTPSTGWRRSRAEPRHGGMTGRRQLAGPAAALRASRRAVGPRAPGGAVCRGVSRGTARPAGCRVGQLTPAGVAAAVAGCRAGRTPRDRPRRCDALTRAERARRRARRRGADQPPDRRAAVRLAAHRRRPPVPHLPQAGDRLARQARRADGRDRLSAECPAGNRPTGRRRMTVVPDLTYRVVIALCRALFRAFGLRIRVVRRRAPARRRAGRRGREPQQLPRLHVRRAGGGGAWTAGAVHGQGVGVPVPAVGSADARRWPTSRSTGRTASWPPGRRCGPCGRRGGGRLPRGDHRPGVRRQGRRGLPARGGLPGAGHRRPAGAGRALGHPPDLHGRRPLLSCAAARPSRWSSAHRSCRWPGRTPKR